MLTSILSHKLENIIFAEIKLDPTQKNYSQDHTLNCLTFFPTINKWINKIK